MSALPASTGGASSLTTASRGKRLTQDVVFGLFGLATVIVCIPVVVVSVYVIREGGGAIDASFIFDGPRRDGIEGGFWPVIVFTIYSLILVILMAVPVGVMSAIYLSEYARPGRLLRLINLTIVNLAGVPSIVYGLFGAAFFLEALDPLFSTKSTQPIWIASATLAVQALAIIITSSREALQTVPTGIREGSLALGVSRLRTTFFITLPQAVQGIVTGTLLAVSRAAGETAPVIVVGAILAKNVDLGPSAIWDERAQMLSFELYGRITEGLRMPDERKWGIALILLAIVLVFNISALLLRLRIQSRGGGSGNL
jgi:phosphate transport system permease protein